MLSRRGTSLVELLLALTLGAVVLSAASGILLRQRRSSASNTSRVRAESQLRAGLGALETALSGLSPSSGDFTPGEARNIAIQLREPVANAMACDSTLGAAVIGVDESSEERASGIATAPKAGDTLWWHVPRSPGWVGRQITDLSASNGVCAAAGAESQTLYRLAFARPDTVPKGAPVRLTRAVRYSIYRAGDGSWQLGIAEWSDVLRAFAAPQPVAGPFVLAAAGGGRSGFRYFDAAGAELTEGEGGISVARVARVRVTLIAPENAPVVPVPSLRRDSLDIAFGGVP